MAWIESHQELRYHPKLSAVCRTLSAKRSHVAGHLHFLWWWALDYAVDGDLSKYSAGQIADAAEWDADPDVFLSSLVSAGFLDRQNDTLKIHDWFDFCGEIVKKRLQRREDKRQKTAEIVCRNKPKSSETSPTVPDRTVPDPTKRNTAPLPPAGGFALVWGQYPSKTGMKAAERHYRTSVKTAADFQDLQKALANYLRSERVAKGFVQNGSTWFNNWRDWVNFTDKKITGPRSVLGLDGGGHGTNGGAGVHRLDGSQSKPWASRNPAEHRGGDGVAGRQILGRLGINADAKALGGPAPDVVGARSDSPSG